MRSQFPLFRSHIDLAHVYWEQLVKSGDLVIDATCGNGHDTLVLAKLALSAETGRLYALDIQNQAIAAAQKTVLADLPLAISGRISFIETCHSLFPQEIHSAAVKLIVYNLGYLPGGNRAKTTLVDTTLKSLNAALHLIQEGGAISMTCYPGHLEGKKEEAAVLEFVSGLSPSLWSCCHHSWVNRREAPSLFIIQKAQKS